MNDLYALCTFFLGFFLMLYSDISNIKHRKYKNSNYDLFGTITILIRSILVGYAMIYGFELFIIIYPIHLVICYIIYN